MRHDGFLVYVERFFLCSFDSISFQTVDFILLYYLSSTKNSLNEILTLYLVNTKLYERILFLLYVYPRQF